MHILCPLHSSVCFRTTHCRSQLHEAKVEEDARLAAEAEARRIKEEEERKKREAEEEAQRQRILEEEERIAAEQAEAQAKAQREAEEQAQKQREAEEAERKQKEEEEKAKAAANGAHDEAHTAAEAKDASGSTSGAPSSEAGEAPHGTDQEPGSPHPSFNSLKARPTPPATSGLPSPTSTHPPSSIRSGHRPDSPTPPTKDGLNGANAVEISTTDATPTGSIVDESPLNLAAARERQRLGSSLPQRSLSASSAARLTSLTDESTMFGGTARKPNLSGVDTGNATTRHPNNDSDEDGYGQPSPRNTQTAFPDSVSEVRPREPAAIRWKATRL